MNNLSEGFVEVVKSIELPNRDLVGPVLAKIEPDGALVRSRSLWAIAAAAFLFAVVGIVAVPPARSAVGNWFGIGATTVDVIPISDPPAADQALRDSAGELGEPVTARAAAADVVASLGGPATVYDHPTRGRSFTWLASDQLPEIADTGLGAVLSVRTIEGPISLKTVIVDIGVDAAVEVVVIDLVDGQVDGFWIASEHELLIDPTLEPVRAQRVLLWAFDGLEYRLELTGDLDLARALAAEVQGGSELLAPE